MVTLILTLYSVFFLLTVLIQFKATGARLSFFVSRYDIFKILPVWQFFTPRPHNIDYTFFYRDDKNADFQQILDDPEKGLKTLIFNSNGRIKTYSRYIGRNLNKKLKEGNTRHQIAESLEYDMLKRLVAVYKSDKGVYRQISVYANFGYHEKRAPILLFLSDPYYVD